MRLFQLQKFKTPTFDVPLTSATVPVINLPDFNLSLKGLTYDDTITKINKNATNDELPANMNSHHKNIKLTVETNPTRFLDTAFTVNPDGFVTANVCMEMYGKFPGFWNSQIQQE